MRRDHGRLGLLVVLRHATAGQQDVHRALAEALRCFLHPDRVHCDCVHRDEDPWSED